MAASDSFFDKYPPYVKTLLLMLVPALLVFALEEATRSHAPAQSINAASSPDVAYSFTKKDLDTVKQFASNARSLLQAIDQNLSGAHAATEFVCLNGLRYGVYSPLATDFVRLNDNMTASLSMHAQDDENYMSANTAKLLSYTINVIPTMDMVITSMSQGCNGNPLVQLHVSQLRTFTGQSSTALKAILAEVSPPTKK